MEFLMSRIRKRLRGLHHQEEGKANPSPMKWVTQGFIFSMALNIALLTSLVYNVIKQKHPHQEIAYQTAQQKAKVDSENLTLSKTISQYFSKNYPDLITLLQDSRHIEDGLSYRDIALSVLCQKFDFDLNRALLGQNVSVRKLKIQSEPSKSLEIPFYLGLGDAQYKLVNTFIQKEQWPFTSHGLYKMLVQGNSDESLKNAFYLSKEFMFIDALFCSLSVSKEDLLSIVLHGPWEIMDSFAKNHSQIQDFSNTMRVQLLSQYLEYGSNMAAKLILDVDPELVLKKLTDNQLIALLGQLENRSNLTENFALHLALGNRSEWVKKEACRLLYHYSDANFPEPFNYKESLDFLTEKYHVQPIEILSQHVEKMFQPQEVAVVTSSNSNSVKQKTYVVEPGDNLWKIAKRNQVDLKQLKSVNKLESDKIKVGMTLIIP